MMRFVAIEGTTCTEPDCDGTLGHGIKQEGSGEKAYCDCLGCRKEYGSRFISYSEIDHGDEIKEKAKEHVRRCSA